mmetsp:Transcript_48382/g.114247  ORF Transcript_48382/g.114247 Transcript_48382/m.114247 type:complete len:229 (-) Transcript_48382:98-784(-)
MRAMWAVLRRESLQQPKSTESSGGTRRASRCPRAACPETALTGFTMWTTVCCHRAPRGGGRTRETDIMITSTIPATTKSSQWTQCSLISNRLEVRLQNSGWEVGGAGHAQRVREVCRLRKRNASSEGEVRGDADSRQTLPGHSHLIGPPSHSGPHPGLQTGSMEQFDGASGSGRASSKLEQRERESCRSALSKACALTRGRKMAEAGQAGSVSTARHQASVFISSGLD